MNTKNKFEAPRTSIKNNILLSFFFVLAAGGIAINVILQNIIQKTLLLEKIDHVIIENISRHVALIGSGITIGGIIIILFIAFLLSESITKPIKTLIGGMIEIARGKFDTRITVTASNELGQLAEGFNLMAAHIEDALKELKDAKEYTDNIIVSMPSILIVLDKNLRILSTNMSFEKLREQFPEFSIQQFVSNLEGEIKKNLRTCETIKKEFVVVPEGFDVTLIFSAVISCIGDGTSEYDSGKEERVLLTITDVTERTKMKEMVFQSRQDWEDTFNLIPDMVTIHDKEMNIIQANKAAQEALSLPLLSPEKINKCYKFYHGTETAPNACPSCKCLKTGQSGTFELFEPYLEKFIEIRAIPRMNKNNEMIGLIHIVRDITQRKQIEEEHKQLLSVITMAKIEWEATFDSVNEFIVLVDKELNIKRCNSSFAQYAGLPSHKLANKKYYDYLSFSDTERFQYCQELIKGEEPLERMEINTINNHWFYMSQRPLRDKKGNYLHTVIIATDITNLKNTQQQLKQSEQNLKKQLEDLEKFYEMAVGRELKMKELKKEIKKLNEELTNHKENEFIRN